MYGPVHKPLPLEEKPPAEFGPLYNPEPIYCEECGGELDPTQLPLCGDYHPACAEAKFSQDDGFDHDDYHDAKERAEERRGLEEASAAWDREYA